MKIRAIIGTQWGDEGKGKLVDYFVEHDQVDLVIRSQGGCNAGHTIYLNDQKKIVLRLVPSGILSPTTISIIGHGTVIDPISFLKELQNLELLGIEINSKRLLVSEKVHITFPWHKIFDEQNNCIGTTGNGIGPSYSSKALREGVRLGEFIHSPSNSFEKVEHLFQKNLIKYSSELQVKLKELYFIFKESLFQLINHYSELIADVHPYITEKVKNSSKILLEGAQGFLLDLDFGTYPFVTSSSTTLSGLANGAGIPPRSIDVVTGVFKAYTTRVGEGPFPTEDFSSYGTFLQEKGFEFGSVTGRKRRCGHLDLMLLKYAHEVCGFDELVMTKLDIVEQLPEMKICIDYYKENENCRINSINDLSLVTPKYEIIKNPRHEKKAIVKLIEDFIGVPIKMISLGPRREDIVYL